MYCPIQDNPLATAAACSRGVAAVRHRDEPMGVVQKTRMGGVAGGEGQAGLVQKPRAAPCWGRVRPGGARRGKGVRVNPSVCPGRAHGRTIGGRHEVLGASAPVLAGMVRTRSAPLDAYRQCYVIVHLGASTAPAVPSPDPTGLPLCSLRQPGHTRPRPRVIPGAPSKS